MIRGNFPKETSTSLTRNWLQLVKTFVINIKSEASFAALYVIINRIGL